MTAGLAMKVVAASLTITLAVLIGAFLLRTRRRRTVGRVIPRGDGIDHAEQDIEERFEKHFITAHDGFMAVDSARHITVGVNPSAVEHNTPSFKSPRDTLLETIGWRDRGTGITFSAPIANISGPRLTRTTSSSRARPPEWRCQQSRDCRCRGSDRHERLDHSSGNLIVDRQPAGLIALSLPG